jgi:hypothetical protein
MMKRAVMQAGLQVPRFMSLAELLAAGGHASWSGPTVLKPHSGASSTDVVVFASPSQTFAAVTAHTTGVTRLDAKDPATHEYEVEEFVTGPILHFDGLIDAGRIIVMTASRYLGTCLGYANGQPLGSYHVPLEPTALDWAQRVVAAVQIGSGSFHLEAIDVGGSLIFLEIGNRVGGADVVATFELATSVHMPSQELRMLIGEPASLPPLEHAHARGWHGWFVFPGHHLSGVHQGFNGVESFRASTSVVTWNELPLGAALRTNVTYSAHEAPLAGIVATTSHDATRMWIEALFSVASMREPSTAAGQLKNVA